jgi:hypothetical protein
MPDRRFMIPSFLVVDEVRRKPERFDPQMTQMDADESGCYFFPSPIRPYLRPSASSADQIILCSSIP